MPTNLFAHVEKEENEYDINKGNAQKDIDENLEDEEGNKIIEVNKI